jgi:predicted small lipoprotein YifL
MPRLKIPAMITAFVFGLSLLVVACGQKGPLYMPTDDKSGQEQSKAQEKKKPEQQRGGSGY